mmetsp:Transcript_2814/g.4017  ORF Transcript_2814/g.4017 Transcript_2814/m.4017 type:complete len:650 (+) Transcript_2814:81-2030(+)
MLINPKSHFIFLLLTLKLYDVVKSQEKPNPLEIDFQRINGQSLKLQIEKITHFALYSGAFAMESKMSLEECKRLAKHIENTVTNELGKEFVKQHVWDREKESSEWWPLEESKIKELEVLQQILVKDKEQFSYHKHLNNVSPDLLASFTYHLCNEMNDEAALQLSSEVVAYADFLSISNFLVLDWAYLSCAFGNMRLCTQSVLTLESLLTSEHLPSKLRIFTHLYLTGIWERLGSPKDADFHFMEALNLAGMHEMTLPKSEIHAQIVAPSIMTYDELAANPHKKMHFFAFHVSHAAIERFLVFANDWHVTTSFDESQNQLIVLFEQIGSTTEEPQNTSNHKKIVKINVSNISVNKVLAANEKAAVLGSEKGVPYGLLEKPASFIDCKIKLNHCKFEQKCAPYIGIDPEDLPCHLPLFISGTSCSGTHFVANFLEQWNLTFTNGNPVRISHEHFQLEHDILVGWNPRCDFWAFWGVQSSYSPLVPEAVAPNLCLYDVVFHQVRHPLKVFASMIGLGIFKMDLVLDGIYAKTWPRIDAYIPKSRMKLRTREVVLEFAMIHWISWNQMLEVVADYRFQIEKIDWLDICRMINISGVLCNSTSLPQADIISRKSHGGSRRQEVTWSELEKINGNLAGQVWQMAKRYGYQREPDS